MSCYSPFIGRRPGAELNLEQLEECWRIVGRKPIVWGIYADGDSGVELRVGYSLDDIVRTQRVSGPDVARNVAEQWKVAALAKRFAEADATYLFVGSMTNS